MAACVLSEPENGTVASVIDGETLKLADGRIVRLIGAKAPMPPLGYHGDDPWPLVEEAKEALSRAASGKDVELRYGGTRADRHGYGAGAGLREQWKR
jgi:micrococcal nuclease